MKLGVIGLGRMGGNISLRLMKHGHECVVYDNSEKAVDGIVSHGAAKSTGPGRHGRPARLSQDRLGHAAIRQDHRGYRARRLPSMMGQGRHHHRRRQLDVQG